MTKKARFSHIDKKGTARMVDVGDNPLTKREAIASCEVLMKRKVIALIKSKRVPKGDVLTAAKIAGILVAKSTHNIIPMCHPLPIEDVEINFKINLHKITIMSKVKTTAKTGVEMEALTAVAVSALTIYDMCKSVDKDIVVSEIRLLKKAGGKSGIYERK